VASLPRSDNNAAVSTARAPLIRAAGGVVLRERKNGVQVLAVHRPKYGDWSLPKGKLVRGETWAQAAEREVEEESGVRARVVDRLPTTSYWVNDVPKIVLWFRMRIDDRGEFAPNREVDAIKWIWSDRLAGELTLDADMALVQEALTQLDSAGADPGVADPVAVESERHSPG
jgi:8-oxo-dGTP pyrophosphatase MutT (NUDIX family)